MKMVNVKPFVQAIDDFYDKCAEIQESSHESIGVELPNGILLKAVYMPFCEMDTDVLRVTTFIKKRNRTIECAKSTGLKWSKQYQDRVYFSQTVAELVAKTEIEYL